MQDAAVSYQPGPLEKLMLEKLAKEYSPILLELENESHQHSVPKNSETHFKVLIVSKRFVNIARIARSRMVHETLAYELKNGVHALTLRLLSEDEYQAGAAEGFISPECHGGSKR
jgi:BolA protein